jgi:NADH-quinone oxidoreductase subunit K
MMMSVELMLNAANLSFVALAREHGDLGGQMAVFFIITVAAAEAAIGLGLLIAYFRNQTSVNTDQMQLLKE